jgi:hypothetical protein
VTTETRRFAGILMVILRSLIYGGVTILSFLISDRATARTNYDRTYGGPGTRTQACY